MKKNELAKIFTAANEMAHRSSGAEVMAYIMTNLNRDILGYNYKINLFGAYYFELIISDLDSENYGNHEDINIYMGSAYINVNNMDVDEYLATL